jgi:phosphopantothenoylcysteine decarboxylase/phosphopantothenate--cysteine ligase
MSLQDRKIILAITGSIAAYKTPQLVRLLVKAGAEVQVIMTPAAADFVSPLSLSTVSKKEVLSVVQHGGQWNNHVLLGRWADALLVAPCSANTLAKMAAGLCDNMVQAVYLSAACPVFIAPAMDEDMWLHPATRTNVATLQSFGHHFIPVGHGELASGLTGEGRMSEPQEIISFLEDAFAPGAQGKSSGKKALVTAGPTYEQIDPVRFIGNYATGKMGIALAEGLAEKGYAVDLILGPTDTRLPDHPLIKVQRVTSAMEMFDACNKLFPKADIAIMAAAVADFRPETRAGKKIKKGKEDSFQLKLVKNPDILASLGAVKQSAQTLVGFALETDDELPNARKKLEAKNADFIILNSLKDQGAGFGFDTNKVTVLGKDGSTKELPLQSKKEIAKSIVNCILR